jgi:hypothetical protein
MSGILTERTRWRRPVMVSERTVEEGQCGRHECYRATARAAGFVKDAFERKRADRKPRA